MKALVLPIALAVLLMPQSVMSQPLGETTVRVVPKRYDGNVRGETHVEISGDIRSSAVSRLNRAIVEARKIASGFRSDSTPVVRVLLNSSGGEVLAALRMGDVLRKAGAETWVLGDSACISACVLVLAGGTSRIVSPGARIGIHRPFFRPEEFAQLSFQQSQASYNRLSAIVRRYLSDMGISDELFVAMMRVESRKVSYISEEFAEAVGLDGDDPAHQEWQRARDIQAMGASRVEMLERYLDCVNQRGDEKECAAFLPSP